MVDEGQFTVKRKRGAPKQPSKNIRDLFIAAQYENRSGKSDDAIQALAKEFNIGDEAIRHAIKRVVLVRLVRLLRRSITLAGDRRSDQGEHATLGTAGVGLGMKMGEPLSPPSL
jgi:hypothetical protein